MVLSQHALPYNLCDQLPTLEKVTKTVPMAPQRGGRCVSDVESRSTKGDAGQRKSTFRLLAFFFNETALSFTEFMNVPSYFSFLCRRRSSFACFNEIWECNHNPFAYAFGKGKALLTEAVPIHPVGM